MRRVWSARFEDPRQPRSSVRIARLVLVGYLTFIGLGSLIGYLFSPGSRDGSLAAHLIVGGALGLAAAVLSLPSVSTSSETVRVDESMS